MLSTPAANPRHLSFRLFTASVTAAILAFTGAACSKHDAASEPQAQAPAPTATTEAAGTEPPLGKRDFNTAVMKRPAFAGNLAVQLAMSATATGAPSAAPSGAPTGARTGSK
jgi:hypothetical protein